LPILQGILCEVTGNQLRVTGTDSEVTIRTALEVEALEEGRTLIPAKLAAEAVRKLPAGAVTMASEGGHVEITGNGPRFRLRELSVDDYPVSGSRPQGSGLTYDGDLLAKAIAQVGMAASGDDARPTLTGVLFESDEEGSRLVATDGYRLAVRELPGAEQGPTTLVPHRAWKAGRSATPRSPSSSENGRRPSCPTVVRSRCGSSRGPSPRTATSSASSPIA
jgi:DNA polymerase-3 subunit beta